MATEQSRRQPQYKTDKRVFNPMDYVKRGEEIPPQDRMLYSDPDVSVLIWWAEPGKTHLDIHKHANNGHVYFVLEGEGETLLGNGRWEKVKAGQMIVCPRNKVHALRNTMESGLLVWSSATVGPGPYDRIEAPETDE
jgi:quercetin dioxygenase-like cupin family protein